MNRRVSVCVGLIVWSGLTASVTFAQTPPTLPTLPSAGGGIGQVGIPVAVKTMADATSFRPQIQQFIAQQLDKIAGEDPAVEKSARDKLIAECAQGSSDSYFDVYTQELNSAVVAMLSKNPLPRLRVRLNLAVMLEAIGHLAKTNRLEPAVIMLINDPADVVAMWGMKAARPVIMAVLAKSPNPNDPLIAAMLPAVKKHVKTGYVAAEAYAALIPDSGTTTAPMLTIIFPPIMDIVKFRTSLYTTGVPDSPDAETAVPKFLSTIRNVANAQQMQQGVQVMVDLVTVAGTQAQTASKADLEQIIKTLKYIAQVLSIMSPNAESDQNPLNPVMRMPDSLPGSQVYPRTKVVYDILKPQFPYLQPHAPVTPAATTTPAN